MPLKLMLVEITHYAVIAIDTDKLDDTSDESIAEDAEEQAKEYTGDIVGDADGPDRVKVLREVRSLADLEDTGWDGQALPYGDDSDGQTPLHRLLAG